MIIPRRFLGFLSALFFLASLSLLDVQGNGLTALADPALEEELEVVVSEKEESPKALASEGGAESAQEGSSEEVAPAMEEAEDRTKIPSSQIFIGDPEFSRRLTENLASKMRSLNPLKLRDFLAQKKVIQSLLVWKLTQACPAEVFAEIAQTPEGLEFLHFFVRDTEWLQGMFDSGPVTNFPHVVKNLAAIYASDPARLHTLIKKKMATAVALEFARALPGSSDAAVERYAFYSKSHEYKMLNPVFDELDWWDMRYVAGCKPDNEWGSVATLTWLRDNARLPAQSYTEGPWQVPYRLENYFGDSIHGADYYKPFRGIYDNTAHMSREIGAVCGGLSHYGAFAALANGVVAATMGEPGHCAMVVRTSKTGWSASNSISFPRGLHTNFFGTEWSMLMLTQAIMPERDKLLKVGTLTRAAELATLDNNLDAARDNYMNAVKLFPLHFGLWEEYLDWEKEHDSLDARAWMSINETICKTFGTDYSELAMRLLNAKVYPMLFSKMERMDQKIQEVAKFHKVARKLNTFPQDTSGQRIPWKMGKALNTTYELLGQDEKKQSLMMKMLLDNQLKDSDFAGDVLSWCQKQIEDSPEKMDRFFEDIARVISLTSKNQKDALFALADACMTTAQKNHDILGFQSVGNMMKRHFPKKALPEYKKITGENLAKGGLVTFSSQPEEPMNIWKNWGILEKQGGTYVSGKDPVNPTATVIMPNMGNINGLVVVGTCIELKPGQTEVVDKLLVEGSEDGQNWTPLGKVEKIKPITTLDLRDTDKRTNRCKFIRLTREGKGAWGVSAIHVFGTRLS